MLGEYFGVPENAKRASEWIDKKFSYIKSIVDTIPQSERKTAMLMGGNLGRVAGSDMLQSWMIEQAGGIPVVEEGLNHNWIDIGVEKVFAYNPDVIFCKMINEDKVRATIEENKRKPQKKSNFMKRLEEAQKQQAKLQQQQKKR